MLEKATMGVVTNMITQRIPVIYFVWKAEVEHKRYMTCKCGKLCKKINVSKKGLLPVFKFVCINRTKKYHPGCDTFLDG